MARWRLLLGAFGLVVTACGDGDSPGPQTDASVPEDGAIDAGRDAAAPDDGLDGGASEAGLDAGASDGSRPLDAASVDDAKQPADATQGDAARESSHCEAYGEPALVGTFSSPLLQELSGLAASESNPGVFYVHNDSGDQARFFAVDESARLLREFTLTGATAIDWEDIAVGPCDAGSCVFIGDIGDNGGVPRTEYAIFRTTEPTGIAGAPSESAASVAYERLAFVYPDGAHNAETLLVHPTTGDIYVVLKVPTTLGGAVYRFPRPLTPNVTVTLERVGDFGQTECGALLTGGDIHPAGDRVLLRGRAQLCELSLEPGAAFDSIFARPGSRAPLGMEQQGEAVSYAADGLGYFTTSEGVAAPLHRSSCTTRTLDAGTDAAGIAGDAATTCGNATLDPGEVCESGSLGTETCTTQGFRAGALRCRADCLAYDSSGCTNVRINEVESTPSPDWIELYNPGPAVADLSGYYLTDNAPEDLAHRAVLPSGTTLAAGGVLALVNPAGFAFGLGAPDLAALYEPGGVKVDEIAWTTHAAGTLARCPDGSENVRDVATPSQGASNVCP